MFFKKQSIEQDYLQIFKPIFDSLTDAVILYNKDFKIIYSNESFKKLVGFKEETLKEIEIGPWMANKEKYLKLALIFFPSVKAKIIKTIQENPVEILHVEVSEPEELFFQIANFKINLASREYLGKIISDKTEIVKKEKEISAFLNLAAHHIRTPLTEIKWLLESIQNNSNGANPDVIGSTLRIIDNTLILAEGILLSIQIETGKVKITEENYDINEIIKSSLQILEEIIKEKKLVVNIDIDLNTSKFKFDKRILSVALFTIMENAVLYNRESGKIDIKIEKLKDRPFMQISVSDTGFGISEKEQPKIFEKYFRGEKAVEIKPQGFGLGIYLSKKLLDLVGGNIKFISNSNKGATFLIELPIK